MTRWLLLAAMTLTCLVSCSEEPEQLVLYSGRKADLIEPLIEQFEAETGIDVLTDFDKTGPLALRVLAEGDQAKADVFLSQDAGALALLVEEGLLAELPSELRMQVLSEFTNDDGHWVATSGRARTLAYSTVNASADELPDSIDALTEERYRDRVGWAPTNASFQAFVTAYRAQHGDEQAEAWLQGMIDNGARVYSNNRGILDGIAAGEVDFGLPNHYYLLAKLADDPEYPVAQAAFGAGDVGNFINVAGVGILASAENPEAGQRFVEFLLSESSQQYFVEQTYEYAVVDGLEVPGEALANAPSLDRNAIADLQGTLEMLQRLELIEE